MPFKHFFAKSIKAKVEGEKVCSFFHAKAVEASKIEDNGINRKFS